MRKRLLIGLAVVMVVLITVVVVISLVVRRYLSSENLKSLIIPKIEETTGRKAGIDEIRVSLFSGVRVEGISLKTADGKADFIKAREFQIRYSILPLLKKQLVIKDMRLIRPEVLIVRDKEGNLNFEDILERIRTASSERGKEAETEKTTSEKTLPVSLITDRIHVKDARVEFRDDSGVLPGLKGIMNMDLSFSIDRERMVPRLSGELELSRLEVITEGKTVTATGTVSIEGSTVRGEFTAELDGDRIDKKVVVTNLLESPHIKADIYSKRLDLEKLLSLVPGGEEGGTREKARKTKRVSEGRMRRPLKMTAEGTLRVEEALYRGYRIKDFFLYFDYRDEVLTVRPVKAALAGGEVVTAEGILKGWATVRYSTAVSDPPVLARRTAKGQLRAELSKGEIRRSGLTDAISLFTGIGQFRGLTFQKATFEFDLDRQRLNIKGDLLSEYMRAEVKGTSDLQGTLDLRVLLRVSPEWSSSITGTLRNAGLFTDEQGWTEIPLRVKGTAGSPSVTLDTSALKRAVERKVKERVKEELKKLTPEGGEGGGPSELLRRLF